MNNLDAFVIFILNRIKKINHQMKIFYFKPIKPKKLSDLEYCNKYFCRIFINGSEYQLFRYLSNSKLNGMIERSVYNHRENSSYTWKISENLWLIDFMRWKPFYCRFNAFRNLQKRKERTALKSVKKMNFHFPTKDIAFSIELLL